TRTVAHGHSAEDAGVTADEHVVSDDGNFGAHVRADGHPVHEPHTPSEARFGVNGDHAAADDVEVLANFRHPIEQDACGKLANRLQSSVDLGACPAHGARALGEGPAAESVHHQGPEAAVA